MDLLDVIRNYTTNYQDINPRISSEASVKNWTPQLEEQFQKELLNSKWAEQFRHQYGEQPNLNSPEYNYRAAWQSGILPELYPYDNQYHWASTTPANESLKARTHPTAWMEDYMQVTGGHDPHENYRLTSLQARNLSELLKERYGNK